MNYSKRIEELNSAKDKAYERGAKLHDLAESEKRNLTDEESAELRSSVAEMEKLNGELESVKAMKVEQEARAAKAVGDASSKAKEIKEVRNFTFTGFMQDVIKNGKSTGYFAEVSEEADREVRSSTGQSLKGSGIPLSILKRDSTAGVAGEGGNLIATDLTGDFIPALRNRMVLTGAGATYMSGLQGNIALRKQSGLPTFAWAAENGAGTETNVTVSQVTMTPKRLNGFIDLSKQLILQGSLDVEDMIRNELLSGIALAYDNAGINGTGASNQPTGIRNTGSVGSVVMGTNGLALTWAKLVEFETTAAAANAPEGNSGYITNSKVVGSTKTILKDSGSGLFLYNDMNTGEPYNGYKVHKTNAVPSNLVKGTSGAVCSSMIFSTDWSQLVMGSWGGIDLVIDPYTLATTSLIRMVVQMFGDVACKHPEAFTVSNDILTA